MNDKVCLCHTEKHQSFLQVDNIILGVCNHTCSNLVKLYLCNVPRKT